MRNPCLKRKQLRISQLLQLNHGVSRKGCREGRTCRRASKSSYKNTLYEMSKVLPIVTAIDSGMGDFPLSMSARQSCVIPSFSANSCCVQPIFPRNPRKAIAGEPSGKTSSALTTSSPCELNRRTVCFFMLHHRKSICLYEVEAACPRRKRHGQAVAGGLYLFVPWDAALYCFRGLALGEDALHKSNRLALFVGA